MLLFLRRKWLRLFRLLKLLKLLKLLRLHNLLRQPRLHKLHKLHKLHNPHNLPKRHKWLKSSRLPKSPRPRKPARLPRLHKLPTVNPLKLRRCLRSLRLHQGRWFRLRFSFRAKLRPPMWAPRRASALKPARRFLSLLTRSTRSRECT